MARARMKMHTTEACFPCVDDGFGGYVLPMPIPSTVRFCIMALVVSHASATTSAAQGRESAGVGFEAQLYPSGGIFSARGSIRLGDHDVLQGYAGYNLAIRGDNGEHADEEGGGPGIGAGWRHYLGEFRSGFHFGVRTDVWFMSIDWTDSTTRGRTTVTVLQPTAQGGYTFLIGKDWILDLTASLGTEINIKETGDPVGEGAIFLIGAGTEYRF